MRTNPGAGQSAAASDFVDAPKLIAAYYEERSDRAQAQTIVNKAFATGNSADAPLQLQETA